MSFLLFVAARVSVIAFCLLTAAYGVLNCSAFAFDMFIRPQLFPAIAQFVAWHHLWLAAAYLISVVSLWRDIDWRVVRVGRAKAAQMLAIAYALVFGVVAWWQLGSPHLPTLWNDHRALPTTLAAIAPIVWLAVIDHLSVSRAQLDAESAEWRPVGSRRMLAACAGAALVLWLSHALRALARDGDSAGVAAWAVTGAWALALTLAVFAVVYAAACLVEALAGASRAPRTAERLVLLMSGVVVLAWFLRRNVFPTLSLPGFDAWVSALAAGTAVAAAWWGLARRRAVPPSSHHTNPDRRPLGALFGLVVIPLVSCAALGAIEQIDWAFAGQRTIVLAGWTATFACALVATRRVTEARYSVWRIVVPPFAALLAVVLVPRVASAVADWRDDGRLEPSVAFDRYAAGDVAFQLVSGLFVSRQGFDGEYYRFLQTEADFSGAAATVTVPVVDFAPLTPRPSRGPDIFIIALDSLRRDYLSPYNPEVTFTPSFARIAADGFVFDNAFTRHGGTELAIPSIWAGGMLVRQVRQRGFDRVNALEKLVNGDGYRILINDYTVAENILPTTPVTRLNPSVPSAETDLCANLDALREDLESARDPRPVLGYLSPMNVHIMNTHRYAQRSLDGDYPGFYAPYASRLRRIDACLGRFVDYLKTARRYDESIIVLTSDHGDSLGESGHWGHATWLSPEVVRIPLIFKIPARLRTAVTTDLARVAFSTDITPSLYTLLGHPVGDPGPVFGASLFVPVDEALVDRRRDSFLLTASYGATYGLLRRNGRQLYVTDLVERREFAYDLSRGTVGRAAPVDPDLREVNQGRIREQVAEIARFFHVRR